MKIVMVNDYKAEIGGAEVYMYTLKKHLELQGHEVKVFTTDISKADYIKRADTVSLFTYLNRIFNISTFLSFRAFITKWKPDVIHIHSYYELSPAFLFWTKGIRVVMTIHDQRIKSAVIDPGCSYGKLHNNMCPGCMECVGFKGIMFEKIKNTIYKFFTRNIDEYIVPSKFLLAQLKSFKDLQPITQIYNGFELPAYKPVPLHNRIMYAGRLIESKGVQYLLSAMPTILDKFPDAQLNIIGEGNYETYLKKLSEELQLGKSITFHGAVPHEDVIRQMYKTDIVSVPSAYDDNLPTIALEAIGAGRVVVASNIGGLPEIVDSGTTGFLVKPKDAAAISEKMIHLFSHSKELTTMGEEAHKKSTQFKIKNHLAEIINIYQS